MEPKNVKINAVQLIMHFAGELENSNGIRKIVDDNGNLIVPIDRFGDFCHDIGILLGRAINKIVEPEE